MKNLTQYINESEQQYLYKPKNGLQLKKSIQKLDPSEWSKIDTSEVTDMVGLFEKYTKEF